jgi:DNA-binding transcriptional LysR family regulator
MDRLAAMQTFVRVVEAGSFSAVARETGATQSAVSKQVAALERALGARLLGRTTRSLGLTEEGERYFEQARRLVAEIAEAESSLRAGQQQLTGWLRVAASVGFGRLKLLPLVHDFLDRHPGVRIDLRLADGFVDLVEQGLDVAVRVGHLADSTLIAQRIGTTQRRLVAHRDLVRRLQRRGPKPPRHPDDLAAHDCLVYTELATRDSWSFVAGPGAAEPPGTTRSVRVAGRLQTNSSEVIRGAVLAARGIGYSPDWLFEAEIASGEVVTLLPDWQTPPLPMHLVSPPARQHSAKVRAFGEFVRAALAKPAAAGP